MNSIFRLLMLTTLDAHWPCNAVVEVTSPNAHLLLVIIWAFVGIAVNQRSTQIIVTLTLASAVVAVIALVTSILYPRTRPTARSTS